MMESLAKTFSKPLKINSMKLYSFIFFLFISLSCNFCNAQQKNKAIEKLIKKYDVKTFLADAPNNNPDTFWELVWRNNKELQKIYKAINQKQTSIRQAQQEIYDTKKYADIARQNYYHINSLEDGFRDTLYMQLGVKDVYEGLLINFVYDDEVNAYAAPDGYIVVNTGLLDIPDFNYFNLMGVLAHEVTHFFLQHSLANSWELIKKYNKNKTIATIASVLNAASAGYATANGAGSEGLWNNVDNMTNILFSQAYYDAHGVFKFKYNREQETEADIIAYRFLEFIGVGGEQYIDALRKLDPDGNSTMTAIDDDHFSTQERIAILEYMALMK